MTNSHKEQPGDASPTFPPPKPDRLAPVLDRNIEQLRQRRLREENSAPVQERAAAAIARFAGSMPFVYLHLLGYGGWIIANLGWIPGIRAWDPTLVLLAMMASVEAIFLSTFVLITQNRMAAAADKRAEFDLQLSLLMEHELTKLASLLADIARQVGATKEIDEELKEVERDISPEAVLEKIENGGQ